MAADPKTSAGARVERKAFREYVRRLIAASGPQIDGEKVVAWILKRQQRYDGKAGGLGR